jgi:carboxylesterase type B
LDSTGILIVNDLFKGGFTSGYTDNPLYDGSLVVKNSKEKVIVMSFNYRMGIFGWGASKQFEKEGLLNVGLKDMIAAFEWVKKYISEFGGDPSRVTAFGESAGSIIVEIFLLMNGEIFVFLMR